MSVASLRDRVTARVRDFAWEQWTQIGVSGPPPHAPERRAADPEALILYTLEVGRHDPRLYDEVLDWLVLNEQLVSVQRLRNLCEDDVDRALLDSSLAAVARSRPRPRLSSRTATRLEPPQAVFVGISKPRGATDPAFEANGLLRAPFAPSHKSQHPDLLAPINLAFRLRRIVGLGVRAEVLRVLLTSEAAQVSAAAIHAASAFTRQNVREALAHLDEARITQTAGELTSLKRADWAQLLGLDELPSHHNWIQHLQAIRLIVRWLHDDRIEPLSDYMRASEARRLLTRLEPTLKFLGIRVRGSATGPAYWDEFEHTVDTLLELL